MTVCSKCGKEVKTKAKFCPDCGTKLGTAAEKKVEKEVKEVKEDVKVEAKEVGDAIKEGVEKILNTEDNTKEFDKKDASDNLGMALLSYFGFLVLIPYFLEKNSKFVKYHATQGMNLLILWAGYMVFCGLLSLIRITKTVSYFGYTVGTIKVTPWWVSLPMYLVGLGISAIAVIGIVYVLQGKAKALPVINKLKFFK